MEFRTLGCHGGETLKHRSPAFLINGRIALDAGSITSMLTLREQRKIESVIVSHAHLDHIRDLAIMADARAQVGGPPITIASTGGTINILKRHFFNDKIWPDFARIPTADNPTIIYKRIRPGKTVEIGGFTVRPVLVNHTVEAAGYLIGDGKSAIAYSGDTGPTEDFFKAVREQQDASALIMEVAFPNTQTGLALRAGHHTPKILEKSLRKLGKKRDLPVLLFHIKPVFQREVERELGRIKTRNITILQMGDEYVL
jgi:3',5'-cyclic-nucleotide phosphodiesterase